jgi:addiction module HigA family antidote
MTRLQWPHPGEILMEDFLKPMNISQYRLALEIGVSARRINEIVKGERAITADTALRLAAFFGTDAKSWIGLQADYDLRQAEVRLRKTLSGIHPYRAAA